jgi:hypothetical protein
MQSRFQIGDTVSWGDFTDCFGQYHPAVHELTVTRVTLIEPGSWAPIQTILSRTGPQRKWQRLRRRRAILPR